ncbi:lysylphosphatidylglycerol synthase domain-containing protein [Hugenholtzia roseola]|uniref:lysylphosphatidylglycerol synthase domain-containing protein n=1 Tax=Hugenholtzia roseola TaxID=1002 RepID=UPI000405ABCA|nr:lysylphosphatidylglycerol synthase domain-containing protein [Hugenholtzia roseola]
MQRLWFLKQYGFFIFWIKKNLKNKNLQKIGLFLKALLGLGILFLLFQSLQSKSSLPKQWDLWLQNLQKKSDSAQYWSIWGLFFLGIALNWYAEARKWQLLCLPFLSISLRKAWKSVWVGLAVSVALPFGNLLGRLWVVPLHRLENSPAALPYTLLSLNALTQNAFTYLLGLPAFWFLMRERFTNPFAAYSEVVLFFLAFFLVGLILAFLALRGAFSKPKILEKIQFFYRQNIALHRWKTLFQLLGLSFFRYSVFTAQFALLLFLFDSDLKVEDCILGVMATYFLKSLFPFFNLFFDLGLREGAAILVFEQLGANLLPVLLASLCIWFFNLFLPTFLGFCWGGSLFFSLPKDKI